MSYLKLTNLMNVKKLGRRVLIAGLLLIAGCERTATLATVSSQKEANEILVALNRAGGIRTARIVEQLRNRTATWSVQVAAEDEAASRELLCWYDLPRDRSSRAEAAGGSLIPTRTEERLRFMSVTSENLERSLEMVDRVVRARVNIVVPDRDVLEIDQPRKTSACVTIKYVTGESAGSERGCPGPALPVEASPPFTEEQVRQMVARGVEGLSPEDVTVNFTLARGFARLVTTGPPTLKSTRPALPRTEFVLLIAVVGLGILVLVLLFLLVRRSRRTADHEPMAQVVPAT